jgi:hypothetical protein
MEKEDLMKKQLNLLISDSELFRDINLVKIFRKVGLLPYLWQLWELVITGKDIIVSSPNSAICSSIVTALVSMCNPYLYDGDYRPYINAYDPDVAVAALNLKDKFFEMNNASNIVAEGAGAVMSGENLDAERAADDNGEDDDYYLASTDNYLEDEWCIGEPKYRALFDGVHRHEIREKDTSTAVILGITNPILLRSFPHIDCLILVPDVDAALDRAKQQPPRASLVNSLSTLFFRSSLAAPVPVTEDSRFSTANGGITMMSPTRGPGQSAKDELSAGGPDNR